MGRAIPLPALRALVARQGVTFLYFLLLCHSRVTLMLSTDINITGTTYSCQF